VNAPRIASAGPTARQPAADALRHGGRSAGMSAAHRLIRLALAPIVLAQGLYVRRVTPRLAEPPGARSGCAGDGPSLRLLIAGDSAAAGVGAPDQATALSGQLVARLAPHFGVAWRLVARTGDRIGDVIAHLAGAAAEPFDVAVLSIGVNDVTAGTSVPRWLASQHRLADLLTSHFGVRCILISAIPPMQAFTALPQPLAGYLGGRASNLNAATRRWVQGRAECRFVESAFALEPELLASDGFHPGPAAYARWATRLAECVRASLE
jgi:lysophospholipase L1-like esterase